MKEQLIGELLELRQRVVELEGLDPQRKQVEEALRLSDAFNFALFEYNPIETVVVDLEGRIVGFNLAKRKSNSRLSTIGQVMYRDYANKHTIDMYSELMECMKSGEVRRFPEQKYKDKTLSITLSPFFQGAIITSEDITDRKRMEEELIKASKLESIGILAGGIAHDFNNLLTSILGNISFAKMYVKPEDKIFILLDNAEKASLRASELTKQLITFSKGGTPVKKITPIGELLKDTTHLTLSGSNVSCQFNMANDLWPAEIDEGQMRQVIHHIVLNAREAMPEGGVIDLLAQNMILKTKDGLPLKEGEYIKLSIKDHGAGVPEENLSKIFDPYFTTKEKGSQKGMGLGLTICYSVIKNHHGLITVESQVGVGTTFHIFLPSSKKEAQAVEEISKKPPRGRGKVLVMDDEEGVRQVAVNILRHMGYEVEFAIEGMEVIKRYKEAKEVKQPFHAVILDLTVLGGMGGKETIKRLKEIDPNVKAIVSSGYLNDPIIFEFEQYGFKAALAKPYDVLKLSETITQVISEPR